MIGVAGQDSACQGTLASVDTAGQRLVWVSTGTSLGEQRHKALLQLPVPPGTEGQQQGPVVASALSLRGLYPRPAIAARVCLHLDLQGRNCPCV